VHDPTACTTLQLLLRRFGSISAVFWCSIYIRKAVVADRHNYIAVITLSPTLQRAAQPPNNISSPKSSSTARKSTRSVTNDYTSNLEWELIIIDDGSPDSTQEVAQQIQKVYSPSRIQIWARAGKLGLGTAYVHLVCDGQLRHHYGRRLLAPPQVHRRHDSRPEDEELRHRHRRPLRWRRRRVPKKLVSRGANLFADTLLRPGVSDLTGSFRLYKEVLQRLSRARRARGTRSR